MRPSWLLAALLWTQAVPAAEPPQPTAEAIALDEAIQGLKDESLELNRELQQLEDNYAYPPHSALSVYLGSVAPAAFITEVAVSLDDGPYTRYTYNEREARALRDKGLHRVLRANVEPGPHRIRVEMSGRSYKDVNAAPFSERAEGVFDKGEREAEIELSFGRGGKVTALRGYKPGSKDDPRVRAADFLNGDERHFSAALNLLQLREEQQDQRMPADYQWRLAESYLAFGMRARAEAIYRELAVTTTDHVALGRARLKLAEFLYQRGFLQESATSLLRMREKLPEPLMAAWQDQLSRALMAQGRYGDAVEVLTEMKNADKQSSYTRYNLGIALINDGRVADGETLLDRIGRLPPLDTESLALRDKANLTLGYHFLRKQQGGTAKPLFGRVRVDGPHSNRALLGLGWAELAPQGEKQKKTEIADPQIEENPLRGLATLGILINPARLENDVYKRVGLRSFKLEKVQKEDEKTLRKALVPWAELINRDQMDPAVQEGMLAIPFALDRVGAHIQAQQFYEKAVELLEESRRRIDAAGQQIRAGRMVETIVRRDIDSEAGWNWRLRDLPDAPETFYLQSIIAENRYQEALKNYRDVRFLARNLDGLRGRINTLDSLYASQPQGDVSPAELIERARSVRKLEKPKLKLHLRMDVLLTAPYSEPATPAALPPLQLQLASTPPRFNGARERSAELRQRLDSLRGLLADAGNEQSAVLQEIGLRELAGQKKQVERYLVEARFALARIYEDRLKGDAR
ncbi:MAG: tetratricopeptide repeat protein [Stagnimonas sp.]|nr:tetratricopeptide repeat protein [Stagnimonas sp.]